MSDHTDAKLATCASSIYALKMLKKHGLQPQQLHEVTRATTLYSLLYASLAWWGFTSARDRERLERLVNKLCKGGYLHQDLPSVSALVAEADSRLFSTIETRADHVLSHLLPPRKKTKYCLRPRTHEYVLPYKDTRNFIPRFLYSDLYCRKD